MVTTTFYRGRPTRGSKLQPIGKVIWSGDKAQEPFSGLYDATHHTWWSKGFHRIDRRHNPRPW